jgi:hypothetical protein
MSATTMMCAVLVVVEVVMKAAVAIYLQLLLVSWVALPLSY